MPGESFRWSGVYSFDLNSRDTLDTRLGVFADFKPRIPDSFRDAEWVFLGNIDPDLQHDVLDQVRAARPGLEVREAFVDVQDPRIDDVVAGVDGPAV